MVQHVGKFCMSCYCQVEAGAYCATCLHRIEEHDRRRKRKRKQRKRNYTPRRILTWVKRLEGCHRCGEKRPPFFDLHWHHVDPATRRFILHKANQYTWDAVWEELDKCIVLCRQCHIDEHRRLSRIQRKERWRKEFGDEDL